LGERDAGEEAVRFLLIDFFFGGILHLYELRMEVRIILQHGIYSRKKRKKEGNRIPNLQTRIGRYLNRDMKYRKRKLVATP
jgi:hypothetical protein